MLCIAQYVEPWVQGGHSPGKPGIVREFKSGQGKVREKSGRMSSCMWPLTVHIVLDTKCARKEFFTSTLQ